MKRLAAAFLLVSLVGLGSVSAGAEQGTDPLISRVDARNRPRVSTILTAPPALKGKTLRTGAVTVTEDGAVQRASVV